MISKILVGVKTRKPSLAVFDETITNLTRVKNSIGMMHTPTDIGWLRFNSQPLKQALENLVTAWINRHTNFLLDNTVAGIQNIDKFIAEVSNGIKVVPTSSETKRDKDLLMQVMTHLRDVKMIKDRTLGEIDPMKQTVLLLKKHQVSMGSEDFLVKLENSKTALIECSERALGPVKEQILPLQNQEAGNIKDRLLKFNVQMLEFREEFQKACPYHVDQSSAEITSAAYGTISAYLEKTCTFEEEAKNYNNLETLFELQKSGYKQLRDCRQELIYLKQMWDLISLIDMQFDDWKRTLWDKIDTEALIAQIQDMQTKQCNPGRAANKAIRNWKAFLALNDRVKNMGTILPLISDLHSKYMMERHWKRLMNITSKTLKFNSPSFCLEDLIKLELYKYAEDVSELVESAQKEAKIETNLHKIEKIWEEQTFEFKDYKETFILGSLDETVEFVETHQMELMGMMS